MGCSGQFGPVYPLRESGRDTVVQCGLQCVRACRLMLRVVGHPAARRGHVPSLSNRVSACARPLAGGGRGGARRNARRRERCHVRVAALSIQSCTE
eukprot:2291519-Prymnesium_polylepis.1